jgi:hypothetical protein
LLWLVAVHLTGGSYFGIILLLWGTHLAICLLFGWLLARFGLPPAAIAFAVLAFGLSWTNIETLAWSMQWATQLSILFFLAAWHFLLRDMKPGRGAVVFMLVFLCLLASALSSTRGIVSGLVLGIFVLVRGRRPDRVRLCAMCLLPTVLLAAVMWLFVPHHQATPGAAFAYAFEYLILNPLYRPLPIPRQGFDAGALLICGVLKAAVVIWAFRKAAPSIHPLLWTLVAFDLIIAASLGYSRWATGLATATSSRYQYIPLLCFGPMAGILLARVRTGARIGIIILCAWGLAYPWKPHIEQWSTERGKVLRSAVEHDGDTEHFDPSAITAGRARELVSRYGLH